MTMRHKMLNGYVSSLLVYLLALDSDSKSPYVQAQGVGKARGKMLVSPPEKAHRMTKQGVGLRIE